MKFRLWDIRWSCLLKPFIFRSWWGKRYRYFVTVISSTTNGWQWNLWCYKADDWLARMWRRVHQTHTRRRRLSPHRIRTHMVKKRADQSMNPLYPQSWLPSDTRTRTTLLILMLVKSVCEAGVHQRPLPSKSVYSALPCHTTSILSGLSDWNFIFQLKLGVIEHLKCDLEQLDLTYWRYFHCFPCLRRVLRSKDSRETLVRFKHWFFVTSSIVLDLFTIQSICGLSPDKRLS